LIAFRCTAGRVSGGADGSRLRLLGHREQVVARDLADKLGMVAIDVAHRVVDELLVGVATNDLAAFTVESASTYRSLSR